MLAKLRSLETALRAWAPFWRHEFIGSSVLFMADATGRADLKMIDFGLSCMWTGKQLRDTTGTPFYMAPEVLLKKVS